MEFDTCKLSVDLGDDFTQTLGAWKAAIFKEGIKKRLRKLIEKDLKQLEDKK